MEISLRDISLARSPEDPQFGVALLKLVLDRRKDKRSSLEDAMARVLKGMRVDREAFRRYVMSHKERFDSAAAGEPVRVPVLSRSFRR